VDKKLETRGNNSVRYSDDYDMYVISERADKRIMALLLTLYGKLRLKVNEEKRAVGLAEG
jgi:RNA-directed DNA polymerase